MLKINYLKIINIQVMKMLVLHIVNIVILSSCYSFSDFGESGWVIFKKARSTQFKGISSAAPYNGDISGFLFNPAILGIDKKKEILFVTELGPVGDKSGSLIYGIPLKRNFIAGSIMYYDAGTAELNWLENGELKTKDVCAQRDIMAAVSYMYKVKDYLLAGLSLKSATSRLAEMHSAYAFAGDLGMLYMPRRNIVLSCSFQNIGSTTKFIDKNASLPTAGYIGAGYHYALKNNYMVFTAGATYYKNESEIVTDAGIEIGRDNYSINAGYRFSVEELNLHTGFKLEVNSILLGYAFVPGVYLEPTHRISISYQFKAKDSSIVSESKKRIKRIKKQSEKKKKQKNTIKAEKLEPAKNVEKTEELEKKKKVKMRKYFMSAQTLFKKKQYKKSIKYFNKILELEPGHTVSINYIRRAREALNGNK